MCLCLLLFFLSSHFAWLRTIKIIINYALVRVCEWFVCAYFSLPLFICLFCGLSWKVFHCRSDSHRVCVCIFFLFVWFRYVSCEKNAAGIGKENKKKTKRPNTENDDGVMWWSFSDHKRYNNNILNLVDIAHAAYRRVLCIHPSFIL